MSYIEDHLMEGEKVVYEARLHWIVFWFPALLVVISAVLPFIPIGDSILIRLLCSAVLLVLAALWAAVLHNGKRYVLTNKRIIKKTGIIQRTSNELMLRKCENVMTVQSIWGRILGYGAVRVTTGEMEDTFTDVMRPVRFSTLINQEIDRIHATDKVHDE